MAKVRLAGAAIIPEMRQDPRHGGHEAIVIVEDRLVVIGHDLQHSGGRIESERGLLTLEIEEHGTHPDGGNIRRKSPCFFEAVSCLFPLALFQETLSEVAPTIRGRRVLPQRFPEAAQFSRALDPRIVTTQRKRRTNREDDSGAHREWPYKVLSHGSHRISLKQG